ncbi:MAG: epoxyqueuosine reductase QueH [Desulfurivibrio sp.]|nr:epoxyqueuosine reductase QueH [Desulfurivibrio sp.]
MLLNGYLNFMKLLLHTCCGPCACYPLTVLAEANIEVCGFFYNPNIHPYREFARRLEAMQQLAARRELEMIYEHRYGLRSYLRQVVFQEEERCRLCYRMRLQVVAAKTREIGADAFSTTLLYSRYQQHELIRAIAEEEAARQRVKFYYQDFREGWQQGIKLSKEWGLYRQPYCGCIYSEEDRYNK